MRCRVDRTSAIVQVLNIREGSAAAAPAQESAMVRQASHSDGFDAIIRANRTVLLGLFWGGLFGCVAVASIYDIGRWINLW
jgi:hypothetical protein